MVISSPATDWLVRSSIICPASIISVADIATHMRQPVCDTSQLIAGRTIDLIFGNFMHKDKHYHQVPQRMTFFSKTVNLGNIFAF